MLSGQSWSTAPAAPAIRVDFPNDPTNPALRTPGHMGIWTCNRKISRSHLTDIPLAKEGEKFTRIKIAIKNSQEEIAKYNSLTNLNNTEMFHPVYIYFPVNGRQPTTPEAATWACANIDNTLTSPITEWYMQMFGWTKSLEATPLQIGFDRLTRGTGLLQSLTGPPQSPKEIITLSCSFETKQGDITPEKSFWNIFRQIAASPVGRVLLYRLLIEIRRNNQQSINGTRNQFRHINIKLNNRKENEYIYNESIILLDIQNIQKMTTVCENEKDKEYRVIAKYECPYDIVLFHEMLHWYHYLSNERRFIEESTAMNGTVKLNGYKKTVKKEEVEDSCINKKPNKPYINIGCYYWDPNNNNNDANNDKNDRWRTSARPWLTQEGRYYCVNFEEIRTILGSHPSVSDNLPGDDLSENLYRSTRNSYMRFGHTDSPYYEDNEIINRAITSCQEWGKFYQNLKITCVPNDKKLDKKDKPNFSYNSRCKTYEPGIGACKIRSHELELICPK